MQRNSKSPQHYINAVDGYQKNLLMKIRDLILETASDTCEIIEYGMLGYSGIGNLAAQKHYVSLYVSPIALAEYKKRHPVANCGKSCLRFRSDKEFNENAVRKLLEEALSLAKNGKSSDCC